MSQLHLNRATGQLEMSITITVDRGAHLRRLVAYLEKNGIDYTDLAEYKKALDKVSSLYEWQGDPNATVTSQEPKQIASPEPKEKKVFGIPNGIGEHHAESKHNLRYMTGNERDELIQRALDIPVDQWESLLTPLPGKDYDGDKQDIYQRRYDEKVILAKLKNDMSPAPLEKLQVVAQATNGARHK